MQNAYYGVNRREISIRLSQWYPRGIAFPDNYTRRECARPGTNVISHNPTIRRTCSHRVITGVTAFRIISPRRARGFSLPKLRFISAAYRNVYRFPSPGRSPLSLRNGARPPTFCIVKGQGSLRIVRETRSIKYRKVFDRVIGKIRDKQAI